MFDENKQNILPKGYEIVEKLDFQVIVAITFEHFNDKPVDFIVVDGKRYKSGLISVKENPDPSKYCSFREYDIVDSEEVKKDTEPTITICPKCTNKDGHFLGVRGDQNIYEADDVPYNEIWNVFNHCPDCGQELKKSYWGMENDDE